MIRVITEVLCDRCGNWTKGIASHQRDARKARKLAKANGWVVRCSPGLTDLCPKWSSFKDDNLCFLQTSH